jgi:hypothetical protein
MTLWLSEKIIFVFSLCWVLGATEDAVTNIWIVCFCWYMGVLAVMVKDKGVKRRFLLDYTGIEGYN